MKQLLGYGAALVVIVGTLLMAGVRMDEPVNVVDSVVLVYNDYGHGSGAVVDVNCVLTAAHVADNNDLTIRTNDGDEHKVVKVVMDPDSDMALLYIEGQFDDERPLLFDPTPLEVGDRVILLGSPYDTLLQSCVLPGYVVKVDYVTECEGSEYVNLDVLDCHGAPGCSGGPVVDQYGRIRAVLVLGWPPLVMAIPVSELDV